MIEHLLRQQSLRLSQFKKKNKRRKVNEIGNRITASIIVSRIRGDNEKEKFRLSQ